MDVKELPGTVVYLSQDMQFKNPVYIGERVEAECLVNGQPRGTRPGGNKYELKTRVLAGDEERVAIEGEATVQLQSD